MRTISIMGAIGALLCMSGYDCPQCDYTAQTIALAGCIFVSVLFGLLAMKKNDK